MTYFAEFRSNLRPFVAATIGSGVGIFLLAYIAAIFSPHLIKEFEWTRSQFALIGLTAIGSILISPIMGRAADKFGTRPVALLGVVGMPICFLAFARMGGSFAEFVAINTAILLLGSATGPMVYTRIVAQRFRKARGLALTVITCAPALVGAVGTPAMTAYIENAGWRAGYVLLAAVFAVAGLLAIILVGPELHTAATSREPQIAKNNFRPALRSRQFWLITGALILCTFPACLHTSQTQLMLLDNGLSIADAAWIISIYAAGTVVGRLACGVALDYYPSHIVASVSMSMPTVGLAVLASNLDGELWIAFAMLLIGFAQGAEGDIVAYLVARWFSVEIYSSVLGIVFTFMGISITVGALILSLVLKVSDSFAPFVGASSAFVFMGSTLFFLLGMPPSEKPLNDTRDERADNKR
jgi:MFS family permease